VCAAVTAARQQGAVPYQAIEAVVNWQRLIETVESGEKVNAAPLDVFHHVLKGYPRVRAYAPRLLAAFTFHAEGKAAPLVQALNLLREVYVASKRTLPERVPLGFVRRKWAPQVVRNGELNRQAYELCVLDELRLALRAGDMWVTGSRKHKALDAYLLPRGTWQRRCSELSLDLPETFEAFWAATEARLSGQLREVKALLARGELSSVTIQRGKLRIAKVIRAVPDEVEPLERRLSGRIPRGKITDLLLEVNVWTRFTGAFLNLHSSKRHDHLLTAILADGLKRGVSKRRKSTSQSSSSERNLSASNGLYRHCPSVFCHKAEGVAWAAPSR